MKAFHSSTPTRNFQPSADSPMKIHWSLRLQTRMARRVRRVSMAEASSPGKWTISRHRGSVRSTRRTLTGILEVNLTTSSLISMSWWRIRPCHTVSNLLMSTPPYMPSAACSALTVISRAFLFWMNTVRSSGVGRQNCCEGVTHSGSVFALTLAPKSISACTARGFPTNAAKCSRVNPQTPPLQSSMKISSSSWLARAVTVLASSPMAASTIRHQNVRDEGTDRKLSWLSSSPEPDSAKARKMKSLFWSYATRRSASDRTS
mmetsp:Transcript_5755/g.17034  ORF Transcript_5755/g.17034 Transcript_5755/m.17034 type:complete len:261 (+) Transcript_5755:295-1077(+)